MQSLNSKVNNGGATADGQVSSTEWNEPMSELQNIIEAAGFTLSSGDLNQLGKALGVVVATKAIANLIPITNGRKVFITSSDGGSFTMKSGAPAGTYDDDGGVYTGTRFTSGDGSSGLLRDLNGAAPNVHAFGVIGGNVIDDGAALQAAFTWVGGAESRSLIIPPLEYKSTIPLIIVSDSFYHSIDAYGATINSEISSGAALQVGSGTTGYEYSFIRGLTVIAPNSDSVMRVDGADVQTSTFKDILLLGDTATPSNVDHGLLIMGNRTYYNNFDNVVMRGAKHTLSINYDFTASSKNTNSNPANANRFPNCQFNRYDTYGIYLFGSVGNSFTNYEFNAAAAGALDDIFVTRDPVGNISKANYFQGRHESSAVNEITIDTDCILNTLIPLLGATIIFGDIATEKQNTAILTGGTQSIKTPVIITNEISSIDTSFNLVSESGYRINFSDIGFNPLIVDDNRFDLGKSGGRYKDFYYAGYIRHTSEENIEPFDGGGQANAYQLTAYFSEVDRPANAGDSVKLPNELGVQMTIFNNHASLAIDVFPQTDAKIDANGTNNAVSLAAGSTMTVFARSATSWITISTT